MNLEPLEIRDPYSGERQVRPIGTSPARLERVVARLRKGAKAWASLGAQGRASQLRALGVALDGLRSQMAEALATDTGRWRETLMEIDAVIGLCSSLAAAGPAVLAEPPPRPSLTCPGVTIEVLHEPYPLVGVIGPWNFPLLLLMVDALPALMAGSAVLLKPSEVTPRFASVLERALLTAGEEMACASAIVIGGPELGRAVVDSVDAVCLTGSVTTGQSVAEAAASRMIPAYLELGGKDPAVVLPGADLRHAASAIVASGTSNAGQACQSIERVYVCSSDHDSLVELMVRNCEALGLNWPDKRSAGIGPIIAERQLSVLERHLADALEKGARVATGGEFVCHGGTWMTPTVLTGVDHTMEVMRYETFGPVLAVMSVRDEQEAIEMANDSIYGLSAAVFARSHDSGIEVAKRVRAGAVSVNDAGLTSVVYDAPKQALGRSGLGPARFGAAGLTRFVRTRALLVGSGAPQGWWPQPLRAAQAGHN